ncbi:MAG: MFS transporter [Candidatus Lokiarchaeota archaeon]|nr:MFS transporter [Candidatus Lokiarchaeota archaeon]
MDSIASNKTFSRYLLFWIGQLFSILGSSIIHFVIVWWITVVTGNAVLLGVANFMGMLPLIVLTPIFGVFIDKWNRKIIIAIADFCQALITFWIIMLFFLGIEAVIPIIFINSLRGVCQAFHFPTIKAIIPIMVPKDKLSRMNAIDYLFNGIVHIAGPVIAAILLAYLPIEIILWADILTFTVAIIPLLIIKIPTIIKEKVEEKQFSFLKDFSLGLDGLKQVPGLVILLVLISVINFLGQPFGTLLPLFIESNHSGEASDLAVVMVLMQIGMIIGAIVASSKKDWNNRVKVISSCISISVIGYVLSALSPPGNFILIGIGGMIRAGMVPLINTNFLTIIQLHVPSEKQGKVMSIVLSLAWAVIPLGSLISGPIAEAIGIVPLYLTFAILEIVTVIIVLLTTNVREVRYETIYESKSNRKNIELEPIE